MPSPFPTHTTRCHLPEESWGSAGLGRAGSGRVSLVCLFAHCAATDAPVKSHTERYQGRLGNVFQEAKIIAGEEELDDVLVICIIV